VYPLSSFRDYLLHRVLIEFGHAIRGVARYIQPSLEITKKEVPNGDEDALKVLESEVVKWAQDTVETIMEFDSPFTISLTRPELRIRYNK